jgi:uncharacterized protein (DUF427 family)
MESVWDYPRPPEVKPSDRRVRVEFGGTTIADSRRALRVLETSHPPTWYIPKEDIADGVLVPHAKRTICEFKGRARYYTVVAADARAEAAAWEYASPQPGFERLAGHVAFYAAAMDRCLVDDEVVDAQAGSFYGGWITSDVTGPFKGAPGTMGW